MAGFDFISLKSVACVILAAFNSWIFLKACYGIQQSSHSVEEHKGFYKGKDGGGGSETCVRGADGSTCEGTEPPRLVRLNGVKVGVILTLFKLIA